MIIPNSDIILLKSPLELTDANQLTFNSVEDQYNYFHSLPHTEETGATYQRKDGTIHFPAKYDDIVEYNYVMYRNNSYSNKWFYAYIQEMQYINDGMTAITIKEDVFQSWQFSFNYKQTFVEREHVDDDTIGIHTIPENLEIGEYEIVDIYNIPLYEDTELSEDFLPCFCVTKFPQNTTNIVNGQVYGTEGTIGNVFSSLKFFAPPTIRAAQKIIEIYDNDSTVTSDAIVNIYMIPRCCVNILSSGYSSINGYQLYPILNSYSDDNATDVNQPTTLSQGYVPVNKKLLSYPFSYFYLTNNLGENVEYRYEDFPFKGTYNYRTMSFKRIIVPSSGVSAKIFFTNYKSHQGTGYGTNPYAYGLGFGKLPVCAWTTDYYTNWLTQNGVNVAMNLISGGLGALAGTGMAAMGNPAGLSVGSSSIISIGSTLGEIEKAQKTPPQSHGDINTGDLMYSYTRNSISLYKMSIRPEFARVIDKYLSMFGYKVNQVKVPNITGRRNWNYVKTIDAYVGGDLPQDSMNNFKTLLNNGITFWHNPATFMDYSQNNDII